MTKSMDLHEISKLMREQDNRGTQYPLFVVRHTVKVWVEGHDYDGYERKEEADVTALCEICLRLHDDGEVLPDDCEECHIDAWDYYKLKQEIDTRAGVFFTEKECDDHIASNHYHYEDDAHSYVISAWRNPEMVAVMQYLLSLTGEEIPAYYQFVDDWGDYKKGDRIKKEDISVNMKGRAVHRLIV